MYRYLVPVMLMSAFTLSGVLATSPALAGLPEFVRVSWSDADTATTATLTWNTDSLSDPTVVEYGLTSTYGMQAEGEAFQANGSLGVVHSVALDGLTPGTLYHYRVGGSGQWSKDFTFRTGPDNACDNVRFVALGDNRSDDSTGASAHWNPILNEALSHEPAFVLNTGDLVKDGDEDKQWRHLLESTGEGFAHTPLMPSLGNHDDDKVDGDAASYNQLFSLPRNDVTGSEDYYFFTHGDAIFVAISSATFTGGVTKFAEQAAWLDKVLTENPKTWKFVWFHHPIYTGNIDLFGLTEIGHPSNELDQNAALVPVFDKHHVDIVFNGHNHFYQRFEPMCCGGGDDDGVPTGDPETGTTYIVTGGAGALTYDLSIFNLDLCPFLNFKTGSVKCSGLHHYVLVDIDGLDLTARVYSTASQLLGSNPSNVKLLDEFTINKSGTPPVCDEPPVDPGPDADADAGPGPDADAGPEPDADAGPATDVMADAGPVEPDASADADTSAPDAAPPVPDATSDEGTTDVPGAEADSGQPPTPDTTSPDASIPGGDAVTPPPEVSADDGSTGESGGGGCQGAPGSSGLAFGLGLGLIALASRRRRRYSP